MFEDRPPRVNAQQQEQPDTPGLWRFAGTVYVAAPSEPSTVQPEIVLENLTLRIVQNDDEMVITDPDSNSPLGGEWVGWWEKVETN